MPGDVDPEDEVEEVRGEESDQDRIPLRTGQPPHQMGPCIPERLDDEEQEEEAEPGSSPVEPVIAQGNQRIKKVELDDQHKEPEVIGRGPEQKGLNHPPGCRHSGKPDRAVHPHHEVESRKEKIWEENRPGPAPVERHDRIFTRVSRRKHPPGYEDEDRHRKVSGDVDKEVKESKQVHGGDLGIVHRYVDGDHGEGSKPAHILDLPEPDHRSHTSARGRAVQG